jgi:flagellar hook-associated protein 2
MSVFQRVYTAELSQFLDVYLNSYRSRISTLEGQRDSLEVKSAVYTDLKSKLSTLRSLAEDLSGSESLSAFGAKTATSSNDDVLTATAGYGAVGMNHTIHVSQLARAHSVLSDRYTSSDTSLSSSWAGTQTFTITVDGTDYDVSVDIGAGTSNEDVITSVAQAINDVTDIPVRASKVDDTDSTSKLYLASTETGTENKMTFTDTDGLLGALGLTNASAATDTVGGYIYADLGGNELDAQLTVDGISIVKSTNTISDVLDGVTLNLLAEQEAADPDVSLTVSIDTETISTKVTEFLDAYNDAYSYLASKTRVDSTTYERGALAGDFSYINLWQSMRAAMSSSISTVVNETYSGLSQIGISSSASGEFSISDQDDFEEALLNHLDAVEDLFNSAEGIAGQLEDLLDDYTAASGIIWSSQDSLTSQIDLLNDRIDRQTVLMDLKEEDLIDQYGRIQDALYLNQSLTEIIAGMNSWLSG